MKDNFLKKYQVVTLIVIQSLIGLSILGDIHNKKIYLGINKQEIIGTIITSLIILFIYVYIIKKFWIMKKRLEYKIFILLNGLYLLNILINSYRIIFSPKIINVNLIINIIFVIMLIGNIILILTYNRNAKKLENRNVVFEEER
ncbi:MAG: hypothetical protein ACRDDY_12305 [Clostridium sp.]|uniref:hypothetical protein n=1 Tax=Clostridium sp. TaxID=1506 RepID=UPI003EE7AE1C